MTGCPMLDSEYAARQNGKRLPCERLAEENERLHAQIRRYVEDSCDLIAENERLRELVEDMAAEMRGLGIDFKRVGWCDYADRMRELGVDA